MVSGFGAVRAQCSGRRRFWSFVVGKALLGSCVQETLVSAMFAVEGLCRDLQWVPQFLHEGFVGIF